jgi:hypothetical protein
MDRLRAARMRFGVSHRVTPRLMILSLALVTSLAK